MDSINNTINDSYMPWDDSYSHTFQYEHNEGVNTIPPAIYGYNHGNNDQFHTENHTNNYNNSHTNYSNNNHYSMPMAPRVTNNDHLLPMIPNTTPSNTYHTNNYSNNNFNGHNNNNNITMPSINTNNLYDNKYDNKYDNDTYSHSSSTGSSLHYSPKQSQSPNMINTKPNITKPNITKPNITIPHMDNAVRMNRMMEEMKQNMNEMMMLANMNCMNNMKVMFNKCQNKYNQTQNNYKNIVNDAINTPLIHNVNARSLPEKQSDNDKISIIIDERIEPKPLYNKKRTLNQLNESNEFNEFNGFNEFNEHNNNFIMNNDYEEEYYPEIGLRATTTIKLSKKLFIGYNSHHFDISREILLRALKRITEYRWIHNKYNINKENDIKYLLFISENVNYLPIEFQDKKPKRGRPPKNKKQKLDLEKQNKNMSEYNLNINNDKIYRLNFQIVFKYNISQKIRSEIIKCIKIDLNKNSFTQLLTNVINENVIINDKIQSYSLYSVDTNKLKEYEKYEREEDLRKKKKREREQRRRENKKKDGGKTIINQ